MPTSGTTEFNLKIDEIIEEAFERCGLQTSKGYDLDTARRSLDEPWLKSMENYTRF